MKLSQFTEQLKNLNRISFQLEDGTEVPGHFHVTEVGKVHRHFIDCGGKEREETVVNFQLWNADDYDHRLHPEKLAHIVTLSKEHLNLPDAEIEVEYQAGTIGKYGLELHEGTFILTNKQTACLAEDACGIPQKESVSVERTRSEKPKIKFSDLQGNSCAPGSGCC
ncbi:hypothetical protein SAMN05192588_2344 [Nonlabens sp. Hel1_33_55]|uniref:DUF6428 family protein n=1 Tax=Nonlabens sp. Hel1_33_55 TaxID=1336802 RepID=UPI000875E71D|nr:DUF6428 family protein [Nonlabens sp. Hel1_33_55]SCY33770.1 hypothetical protein SAMN05192588_2344 [Nonlabens sp. Hel1_33_55]